MSQSCRRSLPLALAVALLITGCAAQDNASPDSASGEGQALARASSPTATPSPSPTASPSPAASPSPSPTPTASPPPPPPPAPYNAASVNWSRVVRLDCSDAIGGPIAKLAATGDVTGDGNPEAFIITECEASTSSWPQVLSVYFGVAGPDGPERLATLLNYDDGLDERGLREIQVQVDGPHVMTDAEGYDYTDGNAERSWWVEDSFRWTGDGFARGERQVNPIGD